MLLKSIRAGGVYGQGSSCKMGVASRDRVGRCWRNAVVCRSEVGVRRSIMPLRIEPRSPVEP